MENISTHITYEDAKRSATGNRLGIKNDIPASLIPTMQLTASKVYEPMREHFGKYIEVISFYRSALVNKAVGGSFTSQHMCGEAIDMKATAGFTNAEMFKWAKENLQFDQLIWEFGNDKEPDWIHISYTAKRKNRQQVLIAVKVNGKTIYKPI